jgi:hypothetical protein
VAPGGALPQVTGDLRPSATPAVGGVSGVDAGWNGGFQVSRRSVAGM